MTKLTSKSKVTTICSYCKCDVPHAAGTLQYYCCKKHRLLARGSRKGKRVAKRLK